MASLPDCVTWHLVRDNHSLIVKRKGITLSRERGNVTNVHSPKYSGFANQKAVDLKPSGKSAVLALKSTKPLKRRQPAQTWNETTTKKAFRKTARTIKNQLKGYRPDLIKPTLARWTRISRANRSSAIATKRATKQ